MALFSIGERHKRPGVHIRIVDRAVDVSVFTAAAPVQPDPGITVDYDGVGLVTITIPGCTVTYDGNGTVTLTGLTASVTYDDNGNVKIGG